MLDPSTAPLGVGGLVLAVERGFALWRGFKYRNISHRELAEALDAVKGDVRDALSTHQLQAGLERRDLEKAILAALNDVRQEQAVDLQDARTDILAVLRDRRR